MEIKAADVKALRDRTGAGMMDCKKALVECNGNQDEAEKYLKEKALAVLKSETLLDNFNAVDILPSKLKEEIDEYSSLSACLV